MIIISPDVNPELYSAWIHPPVPIHLKVYLFNVTNSEEVQRGFRPKLLEVGPYVFRENRTKINIHHDEDTDTVTYKEHFTYHFEQQLSGDLKLQDEIIIINTPYVAAAIKINNELPWPMDSFANMILIQYKESLFIRRTVEEILFKGWTVPFLQQIETDIGLTLVLNNTFGLLIGQNDSAQGPYTVARGVSDKSQFGTILKYKNESELSYWPKSSQCNKIQGSDGTIFSPFVEKRTVLKLFNSDLCRSLYLSYNQSIDFEGIKGYRFTVPPSVLADPRENNENHCFCPNMEHEPDKCLKKGTLDLGPCRDSAPVAMSTPYFLDADPQYLEESGLMPVRSEHETFLDIEPMTGIIMQASKRIQINLILKRVKGIASISKVPEMLFPLIWMDEVGESMHMLLGIICTTIKLIVITSTKASRKMIIEVSTSLDVENRLKLQSILYNVRLLDFISKMIPIATLLVVLSIVVKRKFSRT
ncbi:Scavenger receptor class B member 1 [Orchesella cincta]|uniref:Scavenger receptor class B member 1 n=1 Tax=Orchesella cincta TaxID=48709 RepID=A0A1D2MM42_ORCCI|nr:Scavenger receptor class B member 1 [Orchesella cincta]